jgi:hypothetical protein
MRLALEGRIEHVPPTDVFAFVRQTRRTALVVFERPDQETRAFCLEGEPVWASSTKPQLQLESRLSSGGRVKLREIEACVAKHQTSVQRVPQALVAEGLFTEASMLDELRALAADVLKEATSWTAGSFLVYDRVPPPPFLPRLDPGLLNRQLIETLRLEVSEPGLQKEFQARRIRVAPRPAGHGYPLNLDEEATLGAIDGARGPGDLAAQTGLSELETLRDLHVLKALRLVDVIELPAEKAPGASGTGTKRVAPAKPAPPAAAATAASPPSAPAAPGAAGKAASAQRAATPAAGARPGSEDPTARPGTVEPLAPPRRTSAVEATTNKFKAEPPASETASAAPGPPAATPPQPPSQPPPRPLTSVSPHDEKTHMLSAEETRAAANAPRPASATRATGAHSRSGPSATATPVAPPPPPSAAQAPPASRQISAHSPSPDPRPAPPAAAPAAAASAALAPPAEPSPVEAMTAAAGDDITAELPQMKAEDLAPKPQEPRRIERRLEYTIEDQATTFEVRGELVTLGRHPKNDVTVQDARVSSFHCKLERDGAEFAIVDLKSRNGTFVNNARIERVRLKSGDEIRLGGTKIKYIVEK